jgi:hypothetical protein
MLARLIIHRLSSAPVFGSTETLLEASTCPGTERSAAIGGVGIGLPPEGTGTSKIWQHDITALLLLSRLLIWTFEEALPVVMLFVPLVLLPVELPPVLKLPLTLFRRLVELLCLVTLVLVSEALMEF